MSVYDTESICQEWVIASDSCYIAIDARSPVIRWEICLVSWPAKVPERADATSCHVRIV